MLVKPVGQLGGSGFNISEGGTLGINISEGDMVVRWSGINVSEASWAARGFGI
jgi:exopolysaccharide biosynthesis protein